MMRVWMLAVAALAAGCAEEDLGVPAMDASRSADADLEVTDAAPQDGNDPLSWVDFTISGCDADSGTGGAPCAGVAPLSVRFVALAPAPIDVYNWNFGAGTGGSTSASPGHTYELPGSYDISLTVGGPGGTASASVPGAIEVEPAGLGATCDLDLQCETGSCICGDESCEAPLADGLCAEPCGTDSPCDTGVCADLAAAEIAEPAPWQQSLCLPSCAGDDDCPEGRACMDLPAGHPTSAESSWVRSCFAPDLLAPLGGSCVDGSGEPVDAACASGLCVVEGARGLCAADCEDADCPEGAACASFGDSGGLGSLCLHRCEGAGDPCADDPWLACELPDGGGALGFSVDGDEPGGAEYCAPKSCSQQDDCGPDGACTDGFCGPA